MQTEEEERKRKTKLRKGADVEGASSSIPNCTAFSLMPQSPAVPSRKPPVQAYSHEER